MNINIKTMTVIKKYTCLRAGVAATTQPLQICLAILLLSGYDYNGANKNLWQDTPLDCFLIHIP